MLPFALLAAWAWLPPAVVFLAFIAVAASYSRVSPRRRGFANPGSAPVFTRQES